MIFKDFQGFWAKMAKNSQKWRFRPKRPKMAENAKNSRFWAPGGKKRPREAKKCKKRARGSRAKVGDLSDFVAN